MRYGGSNPPLCTIDFEVSGDCCGSKPGRQRKNGNYADGSGSLGGFSLADDGAGQVSVADLDTVRFFCLSRHTDSAAFAVGLYGQRV